MAGHQSRQGSTPFRWTTVFYLFLVLVFPLAFMNTAHAQEEAKAEKYGDGECDILLQGLKLKSS
jgi:hypothetical protein